MITKENLIAQYEEQGKKLDVIEKDGEKYVKVEFVYHLIDHLKELEKQLNIIKGLLEWTDLEKKILNHVGIVDSRD